MREPSIRQGRHLLTYGGIALAVIGVSAAYAENCALCYTQAASAGSRIIQGLRSGILVLVIVPMLMSVGITVLAYRKRNQFSRPDREDQPGTDW